MSFKVRKPSCEFSLLDQDEITEITAASDYIIPDYLTPLSVYFQTLRLNQTQVASTSGHSFSLDNDKLALRCSDMRLNQDPKKQGMGRRHNNSIFDFVLLRRVIQFLIRLIPDLIQSAVAWNSPSAGPAVLAFNHSNTWHSTDAL